MYDWPIKPFKKNKPLLGTMGEYRGDPRKDITALHSGTDLFVGRQAGNLLVYAPSVGLVRRLNPTRGNPSAGKANIRVGHFGFNHITTPLPNPGADFLWNRKQMRLPEKLPIYVQEVGDPLYTSRKGVRRPRLDAHFQPGKVPSGFPKIAFRKKAADDYEQVVFWPRDVPIGRGVNGGDLHCIYYSTADGPFRQPNAVGNGLEFFKRFSNRRNPKAEGLLMTKRNGGNTLLSLGRNRAAAVHKAGDGGIDFKLFAHTAYRAKCGLYQIEYEILNDQGTTTQRVNLWKFTTHPPRAASFLIVDPMRSRFKTPQNKFTVYSLTHANRRGIAAKNHWEIENSKKWADGCYAIKVWLKNLRGPRPAGGGAAPTNDVLYGAEWRVKTLASGNRRVTVTSKFEKRPAGWVPAFPGCPARETRVLRTLTPGAPGEAIPSIRRMPVERIEGIGPANGRRLRDAGVRSTESLLLRGADRPGRASLARESQLSETRVRDWVNQADLLRVRGVGPQSAELLEKSGVDSVAELRNRAAPALAETLAKTNRSRNLMSRSPSETTVQRWIDDASQLGILVES